MTLFFSLSTATHVMLFLRIYPELLHISEDSDVQVADELVKEFKLDPTITFDEKNIRRRIYDALNVLMAMDIITRDKKNIRCCAAAVCSVARAPVRSKNLILNPTPQTWDQVEGLPAEFGERTPNPSTPARRVEA